jgi:hypothetical protein
MQQKGYFVALWSDTDIAQIQPPAPSLGNNRRLNKKTGGPVKPSAVIIHVESLDEPPLRLLLGSDAVHLAEQNDVARIEADRKWRDLSVRRFRGGRRLVRHSQRSRGETDRLNLRSIVPVLDPTNTL